MSVIELVVSAVVSLIVWGFLIVGLYHLIQDGVRRVRPSVKRVAPRRSPQRAG